MGETPLHHFDTGNLPPAPEGDKGAIRRDCLASGSSRAI
jgi:hypothetical protein